MIPILNEVASTGCWCPFVSLSQEGLLAGLRNAARSAGYDVWGSAEDVAMGIWASLQQRTSADTVKLSAFDDMVKTALCDIGYTEVAFAFQTTCPYQKVSLLSCGQNPPLQDERDFFMRLGYKIQHAHLQGVQHLHFTDLSGSEAVLDSLESFFPWYRVSFGRTKIVRFVRRQIQSLSWTQPVRCSIS